MHSGNSVVQKMCSADIMGSATSSQGIRGYIPVVGTSMFTYFLIDGMFVKNNHKIY